MHFSLFQHLKSIEKVIYNSWILCVNSEIHLKNSNGIQQQGILLLNIFEIQLFHHSNPSGLLIHKQKPFENKLRISKDKCNFFSLSGTALSQGFSFITVIVTVQRTEQCNG